MKLEEIVVKQNLNPIMLEAYWGISSGQEIIASFAVKPTSSILSSRDTINKKGKNTKISVKGRHDPCVGIRAVPIGEAMMSCVLLDHYLLNRAQCGQ